MMGAGPGSLTVAAPRKEDMDLKRKVAIAAAAAAPMLIAPAAAAASTTLIGSGSSAEQPVLTALFHRYKRVKPSINFVYTADGGNAGVKDVQSRHSQFAINTRAPLPSDSGTTQYKLYLDGLCVDVNDANHLTNLSIKHTANIFLGLTTSWSGVSGSGLGATTIDPIGRNSSAGSYTFFQQAVLGGKTQSSSVEQLDSDGLVAVAIKKDKHAIGYVGLANSHSTSGIRPLKLNGYACNKTNIKSEKYPMSRFIWGVLPSKRPSLAAERFIEWVRTSRAAGRIIGEFAVPAFNK